MFYLQLLVLTLIAASYISFIHYIIYKIITEYNKMITIRDYKQNGNMWTKFNRFIFGFISIIIVIALLFIPIFWIIGIMYLIRGNKNSVKVQTNKIGINLFATIPVIITLTLFFGIVLFALIILHFNMFALLSFSVGFFYLLYIIDIGFYIILWIKHWGVHKQIYYKTMDKLYDGNRSGVSNVQVEKWICENHTTETIKSEYGILYENVEEWYESDDTKQVYGFFYKFLNIYCPFWIGLVSVLFTIIYFDIPNKVFAISNYSNMSIVYSPLDTSVGYAFIYFFSSGVVLTIVLCFLMTYLLNSKIIHDLKLHIRNKRQILIFIITVLVILCNVYVYFCSLTPSFASNTLTNYEYTLTFKEYKKILVDEVRDVRDYDSYTISEKVSFMFQNPKKFAENLEDQWELEKSDDYFNENLDESIYDCSKRYCIKLNDNIFDILYITPSSVELFFNNGSSKMGFYVEDTKEVKIDFDMYFSSYLSEYLNNLTNEEQLILYKAKRYYETETETTESKPLYVETIYGHYYDDTGYELIVNYDPKNDDQIIKYIEFYLDGYEVAENIIDELFEEIIPK